MLHVQTDRLFDAVVIGGGLAGLAAARRLKSAGAVVKVLEARGRVGGRVHSQRLESGHTIDLGAQFIGDAQRRISALVDEAGLTRVSPHSRGDNLFLLSPDAAPVLKRGDVPPLPLFGKLELLLAAWRLDGTLRSFRADIARLDAMPASEFVQNLTWSHEPADFLAGYAEGEICAPLHAISAYELLDQVASTEGLKGEGDSAQWYLAEGTGPLAHHLADSLGEALELGAPVTGLEPHADWIAVTSAGERVYRARKLIAALPPQLYRGIGLLPLVPETRRRIFDDFIPGRVVKTLLVFERPWWRRHGASGRALTAGSLFNAVVDASPADGGLGILVLFSTSASAFRLAGLNVEGDRVAAALRWLGHLCGEAIPAPILGRSIDWNADPYSQGGYASRRRTGAWRDATDLFSPAGRVHFAGTETATEWRSFMEGALQSAERATKEVLADLAGD